MKVVYDMRTELRIIRLDCGAFILAEPSENPEDPSDDGKLVFVCSDLREIIDYLEAYYAAIPMVSVDI